MENDIATIKKDEHRVYNMQLLTGWINIMYRKELEAAVCFAIKPGTQDLDVISPYPRTTIIAFLKVVLNDLEKGKQPTTSDGIH